MLEHLNNKTIFLASQSPRRKELLASLNIQFDTLSIKVNEEFPHSTPPDEVAVFLAQKKARACNIKNDNEIYITADTVVNSNDQILNKPANSEEAVDMLGILSGNIHQVHTGVCIKTAKQTMHFTESTQVTFNILNTDEIQFYVQTYHPFDKAGGYGIQDWIGKIGISKINGCYYNVMGLPISRLYRCLLKL